MADDDTSTEETDDSGETPPDTDTADDDKAGGDDADPAELRAKLTAAEEKAAKDRQEATSRRRELKPWKDLGREFELTPDQIRERLSGKAVEEAAIDEDKVRREATLAATQKANTRIIRAEVKALAADLFTDPGDAPLFMDLSSYEVDDDGAVDEDAIVDDLKAVLERKPHLAKATQKVEPRTPKPDRSQGSGRGPAPTGAEKGLAEAERRYGKQNAHT